MDIVEVKCKNCGFVAFGLTEEKVTALECAHCGKIVGESPAQVVIQPLSDAETLEQPASPRGGCDVPYPVKEYRHKGEVDKKSGGSITEITRLPDFERFTPNDWSTYRAEEKEKEHKRLQWYLGIAICIIIALMLAWEADHPFLAGRIINGAFLLAVVAFSYSKFPVATCAIVSVISGAAWFNHSGTLPAVIAIIASVAFVILFIDKRKKKVPHG